MAPRNKSKVATVIAIPPATNAWGAAENRASYWRLPVHVTRASIPSRNPKSPIRFTMKAFLPASAADGFVYQKPMSRYEHSPTPSHPTNRSRRLSASTSVSIANMNRFK